MSIKLKITISDEPIWINKGPVQPNGPQLSAAWKRMACGQPLCVELCKLDDRRQWNKLKTSGEYWRRHFPDYGQWDAFEGAGHDYVTLHDESGRTLFYLQGFQTRSGKARFEEVIHSGGVGTFNRGGYWAMVQMPDTGDLGVWFGMGIKGSMSAGAAGKEWWWAVAANTANPSHVIGLRADSGTFGPQLGVGVGVGAVLITGCRKPSELWGMELTGLDFALDVEENWAAAIKGASKCQAFVKVLGKCLESSQKMAIKLEEATKALSAAKPEYISAAKTISSGAGVNFEDKNVVFIDLYGKGLRIGVYWSRGWIYQWDTQLVYPVSSVIADFLKLQDALSKPRCTRGLNEDPFLQRNLKVYGGQGVKVIDD
jgi:hypothetical protein